MKREPRGFHYVLEPLRRKSDWELQELQQTLARHNREIADQVQLVKQREEQLRAASEDLARQQSESKSMFIDKHSIAYAYVASQLQQVAIARNTLTQFETKRDETLKNLHRLQKFADGLEEHREEEVKDYSHVLGKATIVEADDAWLRSIHWRSNQ